MRTAILIYTEPLLCLACRHRAAAPDELCCPRCNARMGLVATDSFSTNPNTDALFA